LHHNQENQLKQQFHPTMLLRLVPILSLFTLSNTYTLTPQKTFLQTKTTLYAGGFEWDDPQEAFDQDVGNPFKNPDFDKKDEEGTLKVDAARLLSPRLQGSNLYLIGMMGAGKSAVGDALARRMGTYNFLDTDAIIESATNMTIPDIFKSEGEEGFRDVEAQVLDSLHAYGRCVIGTGGGIVCRLQNWSKLQTGIVIFLDVPPELIIKRIGKDPNRPLLQSDDPLETIHKLMESREGRYKQADVCVEVTEDMDVNDTVDVIVRSVHDFIDDNPPAWKKAKAKAQADGLDWVQ